MREDAVRTSTMEELMEELEIRAVEIAAEILAARVSAAAGRPNAIEGRDAAGYFGEILRAVRLGLELEKPRPAS